MEYYFKTYDQSTNHNNRGIYCLHRLGNYSPDLGKIHAPLWCDYPCRPDLHITGSAYFDCNITGAIFQKKEIIINFVLI